MTVKATACATALALLSPVLLSNAAAVTEDYTHRPLVHIVMCTKGSGTAFRTGPTTMISVAHVTDNEGCKVAGQPFTVANDPGLDFSVITTPVKRGGAFRINCDGFKVGEWYYAAGYAYGRPWQQTVTLRAIATDNGRGLAVLHGYPTVIPGMSGGPIMNAAGEVVGTVNRYTPWAPFSFSQSLSETSVCRKS